MRPSEWAPARRPHNGRPLPEEHDRSHHWSSGRATARRLGRCRVAVQRGANVVRVHDVAATRDALAVLAEVEVNRNPTSSVRMSCTAGAATPRELVMLVLMTE
jgi:hypothetical protein